MSTLTASPAAQSRAQSGDQSRAQSSDQSSAAAGEPGPGDGARRPGERGLAVAALANLAGGVCGALVNLVLAVVVGRELGADGTGRLFQGIAAFVIVANICELGLDTGLVRYVSAARATDRRADVPVLVRAGTVPVLLLGATLLLASEVWAVASPPAFLGGAPRLLLVAAAAGVTAAALLAVLLAATRGLGDPYTYPALQNVALPLLRIGAIVATILAGGGAVAAFAAWMAPLALVLGLAVVVVAREVRQTRRGRGSRRPSARGASSPDLVREYWVFSGVRGMAAGVEILLEWVDVLIVGALTSPAEAGVYAVVTRCARAGEVVQQAARIAVGPAVSGALARGDLATAGSLYGVVTAAMTWVAWPFYLLMACFGPVVLGVFGGGFTGGSRALAVLALAMALSTSAGIVQTVLLMGGRSSWQLGDKTGALVLMVLLDVALVPQLGIAGAALAWAVTIVVDTALAVWQVQGLMRVRPDLRLTMRTTGLAVVVFGGGGIAVSQALGQTRSALAVALLGLGSIYLGTSWLMRGPLGLTRVRHLRD